MKCPHCKEQIFNLQVGVPNLGTAIGGGGVAGPVPRLITYCCPKCDVIVETATLALQPARV
jgi:hypothetical protein